MCISRLYFVDDPALEELWSGLSLSVEVESNASITTNTKVVVHGDDLCPPMKSEVATMLNLNLPPREGQRGRKGERERERDINFICSIVYTAIWLYHITQVLALVNLCP